MTDTNELQEKYYAEAFKLLLNALRISKPDLSRGSAEAIISNIGNWVQLKNLTKKDKPMTDKIKEKAFRNFRHNGIHLTFPNGNALSTVWGYYTYSDNHDIDGGISVDNYDKFLDSDTVEIMILKASDKLRKKIEKKYDFDGSVKGYLTMEEWLDVVKMLSKD